MNGRQAAALAGVDPSTIYVAIAKGALDATHATNGAKTISRAALNRWMLARALRAKRRALKTRKAGAE
jgi:hypothetical protein